MHTTMVNSISKKYENLEIYDRTGGGDSFASGIIYSLISGEYKGQDMIEFAAAQCIMPWLYGRLELGIKKRQSNEGWKCKS